MPEYRRKRVPGGTYFFTINLQSLCQSPLVEHIDALRDSIRQARQLQPFHIDA